MKLRNMRTSAAATSVAVAALLALMIPSAGVASAAPSLDADAAATCQKPAWQDADPKRIDFASGPIRVGPNAGCSKVVTLHGVAIDYNCSFRNSAGNDWTHVTTSDGKFSGWIWGEHLGDGGSKARCFT